MIWTVSGEAGHRRLERFLTLRVWGDERGMGPGTAMGAERGGRLVAVALFHNYQPDAGVIEISAASDDPRWLSRPVLAEMFGYAFEECMCQAVVLRCASDDARMDRIARAYGFKRFDIPRLRGRDQSEAIFVLGDDEWRENGFHGVKHGKITPRADAA